MARCPRCRAKNWTCTNWQIHRRACDQCKADRWQFCRDGTWVKDTETRVTRTQSRKGKEKADEDDARKDEEQDDVFDNLDEEVEDAPLKRKRKTQEGSPDLGDEEWGTLLGHDRGKQKKSMSPLRKTVKTRTVGTQTPIRVLGFVNGVLSEVFMKDDEEY
jgi:hypothetical protein